MERGEYSQGQLSHAQKPSYVSAGVFREQVMQDRVPLTVESRGGGKATQKREGDVRRPHLNDGTEMKATQVLGEERERKWRNDEQFQHGRD